MARTIHTACLLLAALAVASCQAQDVASPSKAVDFNNLIGMIESAAAAIATSTSKALESAAVLLDPTDKVPSIAADQTELAVAVSKRHLLAAPKNASVASMAVPKMPMMAGPKAPMMAAAKGATANASMPHMAGMHATKASPKMAAPKMAAPKAGMAMGNASMASKPAMMAPKMPMMAGRR